MKIHHMNCGSLCPTVGRLFPSFAPSLVPCHCLLLETKNSLVLVDTGLGLEDMRRPSRLGPNARLLGGGPREEEAAVNRVKALGFSPRDVQDIIVTHLHFDHAGGIFDFPHARVHTLRPELHATKALSPLTSSKYRTCQWRKQTRWEFHPERSGEKWFGFEAVKAISGADDVLLIPLPGHTPGHLGVAVKREKGWLFHVGDSYYDRRELSSGEGPLPGMKLFQRLAHDNFKEARKNQERLKHLLQSHQDEVKLVSSHDLSEMEEFSREGMR